MGSNPKNIEVSIQDMPAEGHNRAVIKSRSDLEMWSDFREGDEAAFILIYKQYANILFNFGVKFTTDRELVKDCLQDFFLYLRSNREKLGDTTSIKLYLLKAFRRRVIDYVVRSEREKRNNKNTIDFQLEVEVSEELKYINAQLQEEQTKKLNLAIESLEKTEKEALYYYYYEGLSYKEIAELLEYSHISSARRLIYRALKNLKPFFAMGFFIFFVVKIF